MKNNIFFLIGILFVQFGCNKKPLEFKSEAEFNNYLEELADDQDIPALSVLIFKEEKIVYENNIGKSDIENNISLKENDIFLMASVSKMITGSALMQLYEAGELNLDDNINNYLPFNIFNPNHSTPITFRMLLTHTSSIKDGPNAEIFYSYGEDSPLGLKDYMEKYLVAGEDYYDASANFYNYVAGTKHNYSNMASALIGVLVEEISGQSFKEYCKQNIFTPLAMNNTYWSLNEAILSNKTLVNPYNYANGDYELIQHYTFPDYPNGALRSSARDMMKFLNAFVSSGISNNYQLLKSNTINEMLTFQIPDINNTTGLHVFNLNDDENIWGHNGSEQGVSSEVGFNTSNKTGVIVLSNLQDVGVSEILLNAYTFSKSL